MTERMSYKDADPAVERVLFACWCYGQREYLLALSPRKQELMRRADTLEAWNSLRDEVRELHKSREGQ